MVPVFFPCIYAVYSSPSLPARDDYKQAVNWIVPHKMSASLGPKLNFATRHTDHSLDYSNLSALLSTFQIEKLSYFFKFFDSNGDGLIDVSIFFVV